MYIDNETLKLITHFDYKKKWQSDLFGDSKFGDSKCNALQNAHGFLLLETLCYCVMSVLLQNAHGILSEDFVLLCHAILYKMLMLMLSYC